MAAALVTTAPLAGVFSSSKGRTLPPETPAAGAVAGAPLEINATRRSIGCLPEWGRAEDAALNRRVCAAVQLLVKTLVSTEDIVVSLEEVPPALRERPATLSFATVRAKILFSRYFFKNLKIYKAKRTRSFAVPAVIHTETGLIYASGSPVDWPWGLAARVLASQQHAGTASAITESHLAEMSAYSSPTRAAAHYDRLPAAFRKYGESVSTGHAAGVYNGVAGLSATTFSPTLGHSASVPAAASAAVAASVDSSMPWGDESASKRTPSIGVETPTFSRRANSSSHHSTNNCHTAPTQCSTCSSDGGGSIDGAGSTEAGGTSEGAGSRSTHSEDCKTETGMVTGEPVTAGGEQTASSQQQQQQLFAVTQRRQQHQNAWTRGAGPTATATEALGPTFPISETVGVPFQRASEEHHWDNRSCSTLKAALNSERCGAAESVLAAGKQQGRGTSEVGGGVYAGGPAAPAVYTETSAAATATFLQELVQGREPSGLMGECSVRDIVSSRFFRRQVSRGTGPAYGHQRFWEKSDSGLPSIMNNRVHSFASNNDNPAAFALVSFLFTPAGVDKGLQQLQSQDPTAECGTHGATQQSLAAASSWAERRRAAGALVAGRGTGGPATAADTRGGGRDQPTIRKTGGPESEARVLPASGAASATPSQAAALVASVTAAGTWGYSSSLYFSSSQEEPSEYVTRLLQDKQLLGIKGSEKTTGAARKKKPRYRLTCNVVCGGDAWTIGHIELGHYCMAGQRSYNEDRVCVVPVLDTPDVSRKRPNSKALFCAVYDGHNGEDAVNYIQEHLHRNIAKSKAFQGDLFKAIRAGFMATDTALRAMVCERIRTVGYDDEDVTPFSSGSTACVALLRGTHLYVGNLGDSRCVLSRAARSHLITVDHSCRTNADEQSRVKQDGGHFDTDGYLSGALGVSRAFGAFDKKGGQKLAGLSGEPEIHREVLRREDEFMIIACDGVFDVISCQEAVTCVRTHLREGKSADDAAKGLCQLAFQRHSLDNLSAVVAVFQSPEPLQKDRLERRERRSPFILKVPGETECSAPASDGTRLRRKVINFSALKGLL